MGVPFWAWNGSDRDRGQRLTPTASPNPWVCLQKLESGRLSPETGVAVWHMAPAGPRARPPAALPPPTPCI